MTVQELLKSGEKMLAAAGIAEPKEEAKLLFRELFDLSLSKLILSYQSEAAQEQVCLYQEAIGKRARRVPLQHIVGHAPFFGRDFLVSEEVLIPRFDTEILVEEAIQEILTFDIKELEAGTFSVLDLCTGSGCIGITLKLEVPEIQMTCTDISAKALQVAQKNASKLSAEVNFLEGDLFQHLSQKFQVIVSNPPYIKIEEIETLEEEVKSHDPYLALSGGTDGLDFYRRIAKEVSPFLTENGVLLLEIGEEQGADVSALFQQAGFSYSKVVQDLAGLNRVVIIKR